MPYNGYYGRAAELARELARVAPQIVVARVVEAEHRLREIGARELLELDDHVAQARDHARVLAHPGTLS